MRDIDPQEIEVRKPEETDAKKGRRGDPEDSSLPPMENGEERDE